MITIRDAVLEDAPTIVDFNRRLAWETEQKRLDDATLTAGVDAALRHPEYARYFVAEASDSGAAAIVGQLMITYEWSDWRNGLFWWIQSVYVRAEFRKQGVFSRLYEHVERLARAAPDACGLRLYVEHANDAALATYRKLGMVPSGHVLYERDWAVGK